MSALVLALYFREMFMVLQSLVCFAVAARARGDMLLLFARWGAHVLATRMLYT